MSVAGWLRNVFTSAPRRSFAGLYRVLRQMLAGGRPGYWASDHAEEARHNTGWTYCAVHATSKQAARASRRVLADGEMTPPNHPAKRIIDRPNPEQSGAQFCYSAVQQLCLHGVALIWRVKDGFGVPAELYVIPTSLAMPEKPNVDYPYGYYNVRPGQITWAVPEDDADGFQSYSAISSMLYQGGKIDCRDVHPIRWPHQSYLGDGLSPLSAGAVAVDVAEKVDAARHAILSSAMLPGWLIEQIDALDMTDDEFEAFKEELAAAHGGAANAGVNLMLPRGLKATERAPRGLDFSGDFLQARDAVLALHGAPPIAIGVTEAGNRESYLASLRQFIELTVQPTLDLIGEELSEVLTCEAWGTVTVQLTAAKISDPFAEQAALQLDVTARALTVNEYRRKRGMPPVAWGEERVGAPNPKPVKEQNIEST